MPTKKKSRFLNYFIVITSLFIVISSVYFFFKGDNEKETLRERGETTKGIVIKADRGTRGLNYKYEYSINGKTFTGWGHTYSENIHLDDTLIIVYDPKNPATSATDFELK